MMGATRPSFSLLWSVGECDGRNYTELILLILLILLHFAHFAHFAQFAHFVTDGITYTELYIYR